MNRNEAWELLRKYNKEQFHLKHGLVVEGVMRYFARELWYWNEEDFWWIVWLLHDLDFEMYPLEHCVKTQELMEKEWVEEKIIRSCISHGYWLTNVDIEPTHQMEKVLFAIDELTGLIGAVAMVRPSKSTKDMELSSVKKKFKDSSFAAWCSRDVIKKWAEMMWIELDELIQKTIFAMREYEDSVNAMF